MSYINNQTEFRAPAGIQELSFDEVENVTGAIIPLVLAGAVLATTVEFSFVFGVFAGIRERHSR